mgnify:CR=1 FL=1
MDVRTYETDKAKLGARAKRDSMIKLTMLKNTDKYVLVFCRSRQGNLLKGIDKKTIKR